MIFKKVKILFISVMVLLSTVIPATTANALMEQYSTQRLGGQTRFDTAIEISKEFVAKTKKPVDSVILCTAYGYADSVSVTPFAIYVNAPILITDKEFLTLSTQARISEMNVKKVYVIGGTGVISDNVMSTISNMGLSVERIAGQNRFDTNRLIVAKIPQDLWGKSPKFLNGYDVFSGLIATVDTVDNDNTNKLNPIILVDYKNFDPKYSIESDYVKKIAGYLNSVYGSKFKPFKSSINNTNLYTTDNVCISCLDFSPCVSFDELKLAYNAARNNEQFAGKFTSHPNATNSVLITTGTNYVDAICAGPLSALTYSPIVFRMPNDNFYEGYSKDYQDIVNVYYIGGTVVVPDGSEKMLK